MGTYGLRGVIHAWEVEKLTTEQAIGQILQLIGEFEERLSELERRYRQMNRASPLPFAASASTEALVSDTEG